LGIWLVLTAAISSTITAAATVLGFLRDDAKRCLEAIKAVVSGAPRASAAVDIAAFWQG
jgi:hypothetical protein